jgi:calcium-dependent protein kinase
MGVITYLLLSGDPPFGGCDGEPIMNVRKNILQCKYSFEPKATWDQVSESAKDFVRRLLTSDPTRRPSAQEAQQDPWLRDYANKAAEESTPLSPELVSNLRDFKGYSKLHQMLLEVLSYTIRPEQIHSLREDFKKIDPDGDGEITLDQLKQVSARNARLCPTGFLSETEVEGIFNSLRVQKKATTIRYHEFIAAGLSKYDFDDRNLKLAFDRLDHDRKG